MPTEKVALPTLPSPTSAVLVYLSTTENGDAFAYLHRIKHCGPSYENTPPAERYWLGLNEGMRAMTEAVAAGGEHHDRFRYLVSPPSRSPHLYAPYRAALKVAYPGAVDLSPDFERSSSVSAGATPSTIALSAALTFDPTPAPAVANGVDVLLIDDVYAGGHTAAAIYQHLSNWLSATAGEVRLTIACPLRALANMSRVVPPTTSDSPNGMPAAADAKELHG